jgi:hypothetical protein
MGGDGKREERGWRVFRVRTTRTENHDQEEGFKEERLRGERVESTW